MNVKKTRGGTKLKVLGGVVVLLAAAVGGMMAYGAVTSVRQLREAGTIPTTGKTERTRIPHALDYSVATAIQASPETVWGLLTNAPAYTSWNSTIIKLDGNIAPGGQLNLVSKEAPDRVFKLKVTAFDSPKRMVWEDGGPVFMGVRTFTLSPGPNGSTLFAMSETLSGAMLGMIEPSLPDFRPSFDAFAADLKGRAEGSPAAASR